MSAMVLKNRMSHGVNCNEDALGLQNSFVQHEDAIPNDGIPPLHLDDATASNVQAMAMNWWNIEDNEDIVEATILVDTIEEIDGEGGGTTSMACNDKDDGDDSEGEQEEVFDDPGHPLLS